MPSPASRRDRAAMGLARSPALCHQVLDAAPLAILVFDQHTKLAYVNPFFEALSGFDLAALHDHDCLDILIPAPERPAARATFEACWRGQQVRDHLMTLVTKAGDLRHLEWTSELLTGEPGTATGVMLLGRDVTERRRTERALADAQRRQLAILDGIPTLVFLLDDAARVVEGNRAACERCDLDRDAMLGRAVAELPWLHGDPSAAEAVRGLHARARNGARTQDAVRIRAPGGHDLVYDMEATPQLDDVFGVDGVLLSAVDVSARHALEVTLVARDTLLSEAQRVASMGCWELEIRTGRLTWSDEIYRIFGVDRNAFTASYAAFLQLVHPDDRERVDHEYTTSLDRRTPYDHVHRLLLADGTLKHVREVGETIYDERGEPERSIGTVQDVTPLIEAEQALHASRRRHAQLVESAPYAICEFHADGRVLSINRAGLELVGQDPGQLLGRSGLDLVSPADRPHVATHFAAARRGEVHDREFEFRVRGSVVRGSFVGLDDGRVMGVAQDITSSRRREAILHARTSRLAKVFNSTAEAMMLLRVGRDGRFHVEAANASYRAMVARAAPLTGVEVEGRDRAEVLAELGVRPELIEEESSRLRHVASTGQSIHFEHASTHGSQAPLILEISLEPVIESNGRCTAILWSGRDVSQRRRAESELREQKERLQLALEASGQGTWEIDLVSDGDGRSGACIESPYAALLARIHPDDRAAEHAALTAHIQGLTSQYAVEFRVQSDAGGWRWMQSLGRIVARDPSGRPLRMLGIHSDIDERKAAEARTAEALRLKVTLIREVHHRVKNNLQIISSLIGLQARKARATDDLSLFTELRQRIMAMTLVHEKLYESEELAAIEFGEYTRSLVTSLSASMGPRTDVELAVVAQHVELPLALAVPAGMIVSELATNIFKHAFVEGRPGRAVIEVTSTSGVVYLTATDDGVGFPIDFTPSSGGSFGWELIHALVEQLDGQAEIDSTCGTRVRVQFPKGHDDAARSE